jgi:hypothetical protein
MGRIGNATGLDAHQAQLGMNVVGPTVLASLNRKASAPGGADALLNMLPKDAQGSGSNFLSSLLGSLSRWGTGADMMTNMLGSGVNAISGTLSKSLGFDVAPLVRIGVPLIAGVLTKTVRERKLDANGLQTMLTDESMAYMTNPANMVTSALVQSALKAGDDAAVLRNKYSDADWERVRMGPLAAMYLVATASPSQGPGQAEELASAIGAVADALKQVSPTSLIGTAFGGGLTKAEADMLKKDAPSKAQMLGVITSGLAAVKANSPADAPAYRMLVTSVATRTAEAAKEGDFMGIGGTRVSKEEQAAIDEIKAALA